MGAPRRLPSDGFELTEPLQSATCEQPMTEGRHYWEVELTGLAPHGAGFALLGAVRPGQDCDHTAGVEATSTAIFQIESSAYGNKVCLFGNGKHGDAWEGPGRSKDSHVDYGEEHTFKQGDRVGCMLNLDAGWLRFYRNGKRLRQEFASGVTGPLQRCVELYSEGDAWTALPGAEEPPD
jgi:hypothetical protein